MRLTPIINIPLAVLAAITVLNPTPVRAACSDSLEVCMNGYIEGGDYQLDCCRAAIDCGNEENRGGAVLAIQAVWGASTDLFGFCDTLLSDQGVGSSDRAGLEFTKAALSKHVDTVDKVVKMCSIPHAACVDGGVNSCASCYSGCTGALGVLENMYLPTVTDLPFEKTRQQFEECKAIVDESLPVSVKAPDGSCNAAYAACIVDKDESSCKQCDITCGWAIAEDGAIAVMDVIAEGAVWVADYATGGAFTPAAAAAAVLIFKQFAETFSDLGKSMYMNGNCNGILAGLDIPAQSASVSPNPSFLSDVENRAGGGNDDAKELLLSDICGLGLSWANYIVAMTPKGQVSDMVIYFATKTKQAGRSKPLHELACNYQNDIGRLENDAKRSSGSCSSGVGKVDDNDDGGCKEFEESADCIDACSGGGEWSWQGALFCAMQTASYQNEC